MGFLRVFFVFGGGLFFGTLLTFAAARLGDKFGRGRR